jgi:hypothetical protein
MSIRAYLGSKIPKLVAKSTVSDADLQDVQSNGPIHRWFVGADMAWGAIGSRTPATTISGRTARNVERAQKIIASSTTSNKEWYDICPLWALALGAALEVRWVLPFISYPGHLQGAKDADLARQVAGIMYLTGIRVLVPEEK